MLTVRGVSGDNIRPVEVGLLIFFVVAEAKRACPTDSRRSSRRSQPSCLPHNPTVPFHTPRAQHRTHLRLPTCAVP